MHFKVYMAVRWHAVEGVIFLRRTIVSRCCLLTSVSCMLPFQLIIVSLIENYSLHH